MQAEAVVSSIYQAFGRGDLPAILALLDDRVRWQFIGPRGLPITGSFVGRDAAAGWFGAVAAHEGVQAFEPREMIDAGRHVTVLGWERTQALPAGAVFETEWAHVWTVEDGRVTRFWGIYDSEASANARR